MGSEEPARRPGGGECHLCDDPVVVYTSGDALVTKTYAGAVQDAVDHASRHPSCTSREEYDMDYVVEDGYYPGDHVHYVDLSDYPDDEANGASLDAISELTKRGLMVNSVRFDPPRLHVVTQGWMDDRRPGMGTDHV